MQQAPGSGKGKGKKREPRRQRDPHAASGEVTPDNDIEEDDPHEADADTFDPVFYPELREAALREAPSSAAHIARLEAEVQRLTSRLDTRTFETRDRDQITRGGDTKSKWKPDSLRLSPADMPLMTKPGSIFGLRNAVFTWLILLRSPPGPSGTEYDDRGRARFATRQPESLPRCVDSGFSHAATT